jgi:hypothetical protein
MDPSHIAHLENAKSGEEACKWLLRHHNSYTRIGTLLTSRKYMQWQVFYKALGLIWTISDDIAKHKYVLYRVFANATRHQLDLMMEPNEKKVLRGLPEIISIYRGCYPNNRSGLSWSIEKEIATGFTLKNRYQQTGQPRLLLEAKIRREHAVLILGRSEQEIIATKIIKPIRTIELGIC